MERVRQVEHMCIQVSAGGHVLWQCLPCGFPAGAALTITCIVTIVSALISPMAGRRSAATRSHEYAAEKSDIKFAEKRPRSPDSRLFLARLGL